MWHFFFPMKDRDCVERKALPSFLKLDHITVPSGALACGHPSALGFLMEFSATEQKSSVPVNLEGVEEDDIAINP